MPRYTVARRRGLFRLLCNGRECGRGHTTIDRPSILRDRLNSLFLPDDDEALDKGMDRAMDDAEK